MARIKDHQPQGYGTAVIEKRRLYVWWFHKRLTRLHDDWSISL